MSSTFSRSCGKRAQARCRLEATTASFSMPDSDVRSRAVITASSTLPGSAGSGRWRGSGSGVLCPTQQRFAILSAPVPSLYVTWPHL